MNKDKQKREESGARGFISGVLVLSLSTMLVKVIGLAFKIPMLSFLGTEGMGYFNSAYEIYALLCVIATAGLPVALSILVSSARAREDTAEIKRTFRIARLLFLILGAVGTLAMLLLSRQIADFIGNPDAYLSIIAIAPSLLFICLASALRGYCQGFGNMGPTALSQLIEALSKLGFGILFAVVAIRKGYSVPTISAFAVLGITLGTLLALIYLSAARRGRAYKLAGIKEKGKAEGSALRRLVTIAFPITLGSLVIGLTRIIDMALIMRRLQDIGVSIADSNEIYGAYTTLALPVFSLIPALITPVSMALVPQISAAIEKKDGETQRSVAEKAMRLTTIFALPASMGVAAFSKPILALLFSGQKEAVEISAPLLSWLGVSIVFSCLITTTNAILQSYKKVTLPIISMSVGVIVKLAVSYWLIGDVRFGALGAPIGSLACNVTVTLINLWFMSANSDAAVSIKKVLLKPFAASALAVGAALALYIWADSEMIGGNLSLLLAIGAAAAVYITVSFLIGSITAEDVELLPFGDKVLNYINKKKSGRKISEEKNDSQRKENDVAKKGELRR